MRDIATQPAVPSGEIATTIAPVTPGHEPHPLDAFVHDPTGLAPLCDAETFAVIVDGMVADAAPRVFAIVEEYGERVDGRIAGWGMAFEDYAEVVGVEGGTRMRMRSPEAALRGFGFGTHIRPRLVWVNPDAATPDDPASGQALS
jgi:hypothetical protein